MTRAELEHLMDRGQQGWRERNVDLLMAGRSPECVVDSPIHGVLKGHARIAETYRAWFRAFPDVTFEATDLVAEGERAVMFWTVSGTHTAEFAGFPPSGRPFQVQGASLFTFKDGLIVHERRLYDFTAFLLQLGVLKAKPA